MPLNFVILAICMSLLGNYFWIDEAVDVQKLSKKEQRRLKKKVNMVIFSNLTFPCRYWIELESFHHLQLVLSFMTIELVATCSQLTEELVIWSEPPLSNNSEKNNWDAFIVRAFTFSLQCVYISTCWWGVEQLGSSFGSVFLFFSYESDWGSHSLYM